MNMMKFNENWKFWEDKDAFALVWNIPEDAKEITLPHDAMMMRDAHGNSLNKGNTGYRDGAVYTYVNLLTVPEEYKSKNVVLKFEGAYMNTFVYVNGQLAGKCPYGYSQFYVTLNSYLKYGQENEIRVLVRNGAMTNSRWYSGGGLYRDVYLGVSDLVHVVPDGVWVTTEEADENQAIIRVSTELMNQRAFKAELDLETRIYDKDNNLVAKDKIPVVIYANSEKTMYQRIYLSNPSLWDEEHPDLYRVETKVYPSNSKEEVLDECSNTFGIRTIQIDPVRGLRVNRKVVNLRGACIHHDSGIIGAATYDDAQCRQVKMLKEAGFNAIRMAHHPMASNMLRACDALGIYVMDESFDMWTRGKSDYDYSLYFDEWWEKDVEAMVRKDRNHPSVIMYSLGNEIPEIGTDFGADVCGKIANKVKELDPTRYTVASINGIFAAGDVIDQILMDIAKAVEERGEALQGNVNNFLSMMDAYMGELVNHPLLSERLDKACAGVDIAGYNYMAERYKPDGEAYPNRVIVGSETYAGAIADNWKMVQEMPHVIGDFTWTGWDYIGEAGIGIPCYKWGDGGFGAQFPCQLAYCGDIDLTGFRRPPSYYREIVFGFRKNPYICVQNPYRYGEHLIKTPWIMSDAISSWTYPDMEGKPVVVEVYSAGDEVELLLNGTSLGRKAAGEATGYITNFETTYAPGVLTAITYKDGAEVAREELKTAGENRKLCVSADTVGEELVYLPIEIRDEEGVLAMDQTLELHITVEGDVTLLGFGNGNPRPSSNYNKDVTESYNGRALAILKRSGNGGFKVSVNCQGYKEVTYSWN